MIAYNSLPKGHRIADRYTLFKLVGLGRSSAVYEALDDKSQSSVALKILNPFLAQDEVNLERFQREVKIIREINHPGVIRVFDVLAEGELKIIVMEYFPALNGSQLLQEKGRLPFDNFLNAAGAILEIVRACHQKSIVHRDLKPQNILFAKDHEYQNIKLVDFGISHMTSMSDLTKTGTVMGTPEYMPPEAFVGNHADPRSDIYSLGAIFYELLAGSPPYGGLSLQQIMAAQLKGDLRPLGELRNDLPTWINDIIFKCLRLEISQRYQSCEEVLLDLKAGEKALARFGQNQNTSKCLACKSKMLPGLVFCHHCGKFVSEVYEPGPFSIVIFQAERMNEFEGYLSKSFPGFSGYFAKNKLKRLPVLLLSGVSSQTADIVSNELYNYPVRLQTLRNLPKELSLSRSYFLIAILGLLPIFYFTKISLMMRALSILSIESILYLWFANNTMPIVNLKSLRARKKKLHPLLLELADKISQINDPRLQNILGSIALQLQKRISKNQIVEGDLGLALRGCLDFALSLKIYTVYLSGRSVTEIKNKMQALDIKIKHTEYPKEAQMLIESRVGLLQEYRSYRQAQDRYAEGIAILLSFHESMRHENNPVFEMRPAI